MTTPFTEPVVEEAALEWFREHGYTFDHGSTIAPGEPGAQRSRYEQVVLDGRLNEALTRLNPKVPEEARDEAFRRLTRISSRQLIKAKAAFLGNATSLLLPRLADELPLSLPFSAEKRNDDRVDSCPGVPSAEPERPSPTTGKPDSGLRRVELAGHSLLRAKFHEPYAHLTSEPLLGDEKNIEATS
jgi:hypothetical protein